MNDNDLPKCPFCKPEQHHLLISDTWVSCLQHTGVIDIETWRSRPIEDKLNARIEELEDAMRRIKFGANETLYPNVCCEEMKISLEEIFSISCGVFNERAPEQIAHDFDDLFDQIHEPETDEEIKEFLEEAGYDVDELKATGTKLINKLISGLKSKTDAEAPADAETSTSDFSD
jgi:hypothetical protein